MFDWSILDFSNDQIKINKYLSYISCLLELSKGGGKKSLKKNESKEKTKKKNSCVGNTMTLRIKSAQMDVKP